MSGIAAFVTGAGSGICAPSENEGAAPGLASSVGQRMRRVAACSTSSPQRSASSTRARAAGSAGSSAGSGTISSRRRRIAREPVSFSPLSNLIPGTVRRPKATRMTAACIPGGSSTRLNAIPFISRARATVSQGWEPWTT
jgi:hypothetical protein